MSKFILLLSSYNWRTPVRLPFRIVRTTSRIARSRSHGDSCLHPLLQPPLPYCPPGTKSGKFHACSRGMDHARGRLDCGGLALSGLGTNIDRFFRLDVSSPAALLEPVISRGRCCFTFHIFNSKQRGAGDTPGHDNKYLARYLVLEGQTK